MTNEPGPYPSDDEMSDDVIAILRAQHERVKALFAAVHAASGDQRKALFDELRELLAVHETAEEMVLRPVSKEVAGSDVADARMQEEKEANVVLAELEKLDVSSSEFETQFAQFEADVLRHAQNEESQEFPLILSGRSAEQRASMGRTLKSVEKLAPTHPHPSTAGSMVGQAVVGPFASLVDRARDALSGSGKE